MLSMRTILHPTDFSERSEMAFRLACALARDHGGRVVVLHVNPPPETHGEELARQAPDSYEEQLWKEYLSPIQSPDPSVTVEHRLENDEPAEGIVRVALELKADLIVMGTHGRTGLHRILMGSVAEQVLRLAPCPVLTVKLPFPDSLAGAVGGE